MADSGIEKAITGHRITNAATILLKTFCIPPLFELNLKHTRQTHKSLHVGLVIRIFHRVIDTISPRPIRVRFTKGFCARVEGGNIFLLYDAVHVA